MLEIGSNNEANYTKKRFFSSLPGISILYAKPHKEKPGLFSFMAPLSISVWLYVATAFLIISMVEFLLAKYSSMLFYYFPCQIFLMEI